MRMKLQASNVTYDLNGNAEHITCKLRKIEQQKMIFNQHEVSHRTHLSYTKVMGINRGVIECHI